MMNVKVTIDKKKYPCYTTCGAMLRFKQETGREVTEIESGSMTDLVTYLWCCVKSASKVEGITFDMELMDFADRLDEETLTTWALALRAERADMEGGKEPGKK